MPDFFPGPIFGWAFIAILTAFLAAASYSDLRSAVIPKSISLATLLAGIAMNVVRGAWLASEGNPVWHWSNASAGLGAVDGLLFALAGFAFGFCFFLLLWFLGVAGGGDVKLFAAIGAWVGPQWALWVIIVSVIIMMVLVLAQAMWAVVTGNRKALRARAPRPNKKTKRLLTFALPLSLATIIVLGWKVQHELNLAKPAIAASLGGNHAR